MEKEPARVKKYRRTQAVALHRISNDMVEILKRVKNKTYTEREIEEAIHRAKVMERRRQIMLAKFDSGWDKLIAFEVLKVEEYKNHKGIYLSVRNILRQLLP